METTPRGSEDEEFGLDSLPCDVCFHFRRQVHLDNEAENDFRFHLQGMHGLVP